MGLRQECSNLEDEISLTFVCSPFSGCGTQSVSQAYSTFISSLAPACQPIREYVWHSTAKVDLLFSLSNLMSVVTTRFQLNIFLRLTLGITFIWQDWAIQTDSIKLHVLIFHH